MFAINLRKTGTDWLKNRDFYVQQMAQAQNDEDFLQALNQTIGDLHDRHAHVVDGWFVDNLYKGYQGVTEYQSWFNELNRESVLLRYPKEGRLLPENADGNQYYMDALANYDGITEDYVYAPTDYQIRTHYWPEREAAYLRISSFNTVDMLNYETEVQNFLQSLPTDTALVLDIRGNGGGAIDYWYRRLVPMLTDRRLSQKYYLLYRDGDFQQSFMNDMKGYLKEEYSGDISDLLSMDMPNLPSETQSDFRRYFTIRNYISPNPNFHLKGRIFLLVDNGVYSAAEMFASFAKDSGMATLIGTSTSGGMGSGPILVALPHSGYLIRFPQDLVVSNDGTPNDEFGTTPDVELDAPYVSGGNPSLDPAVIRALELNEE